MAIAKTDIRATLFMVLQDGDCHSGNLVLEQFFSILRLCDCLQSQYDRQVKMRTCYRYQWLDAITKINFPNEGPRVTASTSTLYRFGSNDVRSFFDIAFYRGKYLLFNTCVTEFG